MIAAAAYSSDLEATASQLTVAEALAMGAGSAVLAQPRRLPAPAGPSGCASSGRRISWWEHTGPLSVVYTSAGAPDLVLPVRLPQGSGRWPYVAHFLDRPHLWHKIDLVRRRKASAPGGWTYEAHLTLVASRSRRPCSPSPSRKPPGEYGTPTPDETPDPGTTPDRRTRNPDYPDLRDSS